MDGCGPDDVGADELKRAKTWREVRAELSKGVSPKWSGASTRNTRLWKALLRVRARCLLMGLRGGLRRLLLGTLGHTAAARGWQWQGRTEVPIVVGDGALERCLPGVGTADPS